MTTTSSPAERPASPPAGSAKPADSPSAGLGLPAATALVVGSIIGTGIFLLPATMARYGTVSLVALLLVTVGALAVASVFGKLSTRIPGSGGPYVYARHGLGEFPAFLSAWSYYITVLAGDAAISVAWVGYVNYFLHWDSKPGQAALAVVGVCVPTLVNLAGLQRVGFVQTIVTGAKFLMLLFVAVVGLFFLKAANFGPFIADGGSWIGAISSAGAVVLFAYSGVETAAIVASRVRDPERNVSRAGIYGTLACALVYFLSTVVIFGTVPHDQLVDSSAPFADAMVNMFGGAWGGVVSALAVLSGLGALIGWATVCAEVPYAVAKDSLFPRVFVKQSRNGALWAALLISLALKVTLILVNYAGAADVFETVVLLTTLTTAIPFLLGTSVQLFWLIAKGRKTSRTFVRDLVVAVFAVAFSFWLIYGSGRDAVFSGTLMVFAGVVVYVWVKGRRGEYGARPEAVPEAASVPVEPAAPDPVRPAAPDADAG
ncbi:MULTISPECIES: amino acid permease [unclassified Streptomyces]|uniref:amino acid permease n=1 Tax=unclassified Streptomyces TaxID=2593676 RepID=UPI003D7663D4